MEKVRFISADAAFVIGMVSFAVIAPLLWREPLPFSSFPMYSTHPRVINYVNVRTEDGIHIPNDLLGLRVELHPWACQTAGAPLKTTMNPTDRALKGEEIAAVIKAHLRVTDSESECLVTQTTCGRRPDGSFGVLYTTTQKISSGDSNE